MDKAFSAAAATFFFIFRLWKAIVLSVSIASGDWLYPRERQACDWTSAAGSDSASCANRATTFRSLAKCLNAMAALMRTNGSRSFEYMDSSCLTTGNSFSDNSSRSSLGNESSKKMTALKRFPTLPEVMCFLHALMD